MKADNQTMDRQIPLSVQRRNKMIRWGKWLGGFLLVMAAGAWLGSQMLTTIDRKTLVVSEVDRGTIEVSVTATGRIVPAFEEEVVYPTVEEYEAANRLQADFSLVHYLLNQTYLHYLIFF